MNVQHCVAVQCPSYLGLFFLGWVGACEGHISEFKKVKRKKFLQVLSPGPNGQRWPVHKQVPQVLQFADLNISLDMRTFRKCSNLRICGFAGHKYFGDLRICDLWTQLFFSDLKLPQIAQKHNFLLTNISLNCFNSNLKMTLEIL